MSTNLINNYIETKKQPTVAVTSPAQKAPAQLKKPSNPHGHLIKSSLIDLPVDTYKSIAYDLKSLKNGLKGDSNDHQLGKINDLGMKVGGLAVASLLFIQKPTPKAKWMEFVGFGSFFASMALWPKIALQAPAKLVHGFDVQQKYEDSMGRKKSFFSDPQYLPWDLYSDKEINKIGNRLGVDKDIPNRREFIQEKMKKIAIQNNTMWMLTAGFATPIMSALICNQVEKKLGEIQDTKKNNKLEAILNNFDKEVKKVDFSELAKTYDAFIQKNANKTITADLCEEIADVMGPTLDPISKNALAEDLTELFVNNKEKYVVDEQVVEKMLADITQSFKSELHKDHFETFKKIMPNKDAVIKVLTEKSYFGTEVENKTAEKVSMEIKRIIAENGKKEKLSGDMLELIDDIFMDNNYDCAKIKQTRTLKDIANHLSELKTNILEFEKSKRVLKHYSVNKFGNIPESIAANLWNEITPGLVKVLDITPEEIQKVKIDRLQTQKLIRSKFEMIAADEIKYKSVIAEISSIIKKLDYKIGSHQVENYCDKTDKVYNKSAAKFKFNGLEKLSKQLNAWHLGKNEMENISNGLKSSDPSWAKAQCEYLGLNENEFKALYSKLEKPQSPEEIEEVFNNVKYFNENEVNAIKKIRKDFAREKVPGLKSTFYRLLNTLDLFRRVANENFGPHLHNGLRQEMVEEALETAIDTFLSGHAGDYAIKFYTRRNPTPDNALGVPAVVKGKIIHKFYGIKDRMIDFYTNAKVKTPVPYKTVDIPNDTEFFGRVVRLMFDNDQDKVTTDTLGKDLTDALRKHNKDFLEKVVNAEYPFKKNHLYSGYDAKATAAEKFRIVGLAVDEMFTKLFNQKFNTNKWMKIFGTTALILTGVTLASQFAFGKMSDPKKIKKDTK